MKTVSLRKILLLAIAMMPLLSFFRTASADSSKYPQFAQQSPPANVPSSTSPPGRNIKMWPVIALETRSSPTRRRNATVHLASCCLNQEAP